MSRFVKDEFLSELHLVLLVHKFLGMKDREVRPVIQTLFLPSPSVSENPASILSKLPWI